MQDGIIKGTGNSRYLKGAGWPVTYEEFKSMAEAGMLPIDLNGINADGWQQIGMAFAKATMLSDTTAAKYFASLTGAETVDQVLSLLGTYNQYWWRRRVYIENTGYAEKQTDVNNLLSAIFYFANGSTNTIYYSSSISIDLNGIVTLSNPQSITIGYSSVLDILKGKYVSNLARCDGWTDGTIQSQIFYISTDAIIDNGGNLYWYIDPRGHSGWMYHITSQYYDSPTIGEWEYLQSSVRNSYYDSGIVDNYEYQYLDIPLSNAVTAPKFSTGFYTGTGTYGLSSLNSLTFDFPVLELDIAGTPNASASDAVAKYTAHLVLPNPSNNNAYCNEVICNGSGSSLIYYYASLDGKTVYWWSTVNAQIQMNYADYTYRYEAKGIAL